MKFRLLVDPTREEEVVVTAHARSALTDRLEALVTQYAGTEVCTGVLTVTLMAFIAAGITMVYRVEQLPLLSAVLIHGGVLYLDYLMIYLVNRWIPRDRAAIGGFTAIFAVSYAVVWLLIYCSIRAKTERLNKK